MVLSLTTAEVLALLDCTVWARHAINAAELISPENRRTCLETIENLRAEVEKQLRPQTA